jgi:hypothetical protein
MARWWVLVAALAVAACSGGAGTSGRGATTSPASTAAADVSSIPTVATTAIPGAAPTSAPTVGGTSAPVPTTTIPLAPPPAGEAATTTAPSADDSPGSTSPTPAATPTTVPAAGGTGKGDPGAFCAAVDKVLPLYLTTLILVDSGDVTSDGTKFEVAVAPALSGPMHAAASAAPALVVSPFQRWAARADAAVGALKGAGATDGQLASLGTAYGAQVQRATSGGVSQSPPDPVAAAAAAGIDANRVGAAASAFAAANGDFDKFAGVLGQELTLTPGQLNDLSAQYPCAADLANFSG